MGVVVRQKNKVRGAPWWVFINHQGKRKSLKVGDKAAAEKVASKIREGLKTGQVGIETETRKTIFGPYALEWLEGYVATRLKPATYRGYKNVLDVHLLPEFEGRNVEEITRREVREFLVNKGRQGLSEKTVHNIRTCLSSILSHAYEDELIPVNPASRLGRLIRNGPSESKVDFLTREEATAFMAAVAKHAPRHYPIFLYALRTGMRLGELTALQWGDIDFKGKFINLERGFSAGELTTPKSGGSRRIDMSDQLATTLQELRSERKKEALAKGWGIVPVWVFCNEEGGHLDGDNLRSRVFYKVLEKAGLRWLRIHDLRHTFASLLIQQGESLAYVRDQLGHHSIQITVDTYGHLIPGANRAAVNRLDDDLPERIF